MEINLIGELMLRKALLALVVFLLLLIPLRPVLAQSGEGDFQLRLRRTFGYQSGNQIQGSFTLEVTGEAEFHEVTYWVDDELLATVTESPFRTSFNTSEYTPGTHEIRAVGFGMHGEQLESQVIRVTFITAEEGWQTAGRIAAWILGSVVALMLLGAIGMGLISRGKRRFELGVYGAAGGAVCDRCSLPFTRHVLSFNLLFGKLERCPHCGRIAIVPRASRTDLEEAEDRYRADRQEGRREIHHEKEEYLQILDDSRFED
jgi:rRNA maturation protein Nop10